MSYFPHAFQKGFLGTKATQTATGSRKAVDSGFLTSTGVKTVNLRDTASPYQLGTGTFGFFETAGYTSVNAASAEVAAGKPLILAGASIFQNDKIGPFHGGYAESNKSKMINPRFINKFYKTTGAAPEQEIVHVGMTNFNAGVSTVVITTAGAAFTNGTNVLTPTGGSGTGLTLNVTVAGNIVTAVTIATPGVGYANGDVVSVSDGTSTTNATITVGLACNYEFLCGETYNLHLNLYGTPVLRVLNHDAYRDFAAYAGCCAADAIAPTAVDSTLIMLDWAKQIITSPYTKDFIRPIVYTENGTALFATAAEALAGGGLATDIFDLYVSPGHVDGALAGLRLVGAYVETKFGNCSFQLSDGYEKEIVRIQASIMNNLMDVCGQDSLCVNTECCGFGGEGFGETVLREIVMSESYLQNKFSEDVRIREITQGNDLLNAIDRTILWDRYVIVHSIPRLNNATSLLDNDQYALTIYVPNSFGGSAAFETFMSTWLTAAGSIVELEEFDHISCVPADVIVR